LAQRIRRPVADKIQQREEFVHLARWLIPRWLHALLLAALMPAPFTAAVSAAEILRVGKAIPEAFSFVPLDIGIRKGFFAKYGIEINQTAFAGRSGCREALY
jgi:ABC-type nitrate/sulfonate/bicarbonate transport system substrate-binding protein